MPALRSRLCAGWSEQHHVRARVDRNADDTDDHDNDDHYSDDPDDYSDDPDDDNTANTLPERPGADFPRLRAPARLDDTVHRDDNDDAGETKLYGWRGACGQQLCVSGRSPLWDNIIAVVGGHNIGAEDDNREPKNDSSDAAAKAGDAAGEARDAAVKAGDDDNGCATAGATDVQAFEPPQKALTTAIAPALPQAVP